MEQPTKPDLTGELQVKIVEVESGKTTYKHEGDIALWRHLDSKYLLRGYVTINGVRYLVSLVENGGAEE